MQEEAEAGFDALTIYIFVCMLFLSIAMMYHGVILFKLQKNSRIEDANVDHKQDIQLSKLVIKWDRKMLVIYITFFILFNTFYFISYSS